MTFCLNDFLTTGNIASNLMQVYNATGLLAILFSVILLTSFC